MNFRLIIILSFFCMLLSDAVDYMSIAMKLNVDATYITAVFRIASLVCLLIIVYRIKWQPHIPQLPRLFFSILIAWNTITIIRGGFNAEDYWDWKYLFLNSVFSFWVPFAMVAGVVFEYSKSLFSAIVTKLFLFGFIIIPLTLSIDIERELFARGLMISVPFFILASGYFDKKWRWLVLLVAATSVYISYDFRTNVLRILVALLILILYYLRKFITTSVLKAACLVCFLIPPVLMFLGISGQYNVFKPTEDIEKYEFDYANGKESNMAVDTRTFLYEEVFASMSPKNSFLIGEGGTGKYMTAYFDESVDQSRGRYGAEVGFLTILLDSGIAGVVLYALMLFSAIYYAVSYSNNFLCKMFALFLSFRWILFFIEDNTGFNMNNYFVWLTIGLCLSKGFRALSDADMTAYFNFKKKPQYSTAFT